MAIDTTATTNNPTRLIPYKDEEAMDLLPSPGYRFVPTDQELIRYYLRPKVGNRPLPRWNVISDRDLYEDEEPAEIFGRRSVNEMYFFTRIKKKYQNGKNIDRVIAGKGAWKSQRTREVYDEEGKKLLGLKNSLNFVSSHQTATKNPSWIMHEYTLIDNDHKIALCRIKRGRGNTISVNGTGGVGGVSPPRILSMNDGSGLGRIDEEEEEDNKLAATAALYKMSNLEKQKAGGAGGAGGDGNQPNQPVEVQHLSDSNSVEASSDYDDVNQPPVTKDKGKAVAVEDSDPETGNYVVGSAIRKYNRRNTGNEGSVSVAKQNLAAKPSPSNGDGPSKVTREFLPPNPVVEPTFDIVPKVTRLALPIQSDGNGSIVKSVAPADDLIKVIDEASTKLQLVGIAFSSKYHSIVEKCENLERKCADLEAELEQKNRELSEKRVVIMEKNWENKTLHDVLRNEKANYKRKLEEFQAAEAEKMAQLHKRKLEEFQAAEAEKTAQLHKAKRPHYARLSELPPQQVPFDNTPSRNPK